MAIEIDFSLVKCLAYDFDGVMTDNKVLVSEDGIESVVVNRSDGYAVAKLKEMGLKQVIISTEKNPVIAVRAEKLSINAVYGVENKGEAILSFCKRESILPAEVMFIGNDINDIPAFEVAGFTGAPFDAEKIVYDMADWKSSRNGGNGVIRELYGLIAGSQLGDGGFMKQDIIDGEKEGQEFQRRNEKCTLKNSK